MKKNLLFSDCKQPAKIRSQIFGRLPFSYIIAGFLLLQSSPSVAQFVGNSTVNTPICTAATSQFAPQIISDGAGGYIITWYDLRNGSNDDIYVQKINASGVVQWTANGVAVSTANRDQFVPQIVSDGAGGAIITWQDQRNGSFNYDIYAQRVNASGVVQWTADGVAITNAANNQQNPQIASDGAGGAIITWMDQRGSTFDVYAQRINASGVVQWTTDGVALSTAGNSQFNPQLVSDGAGGAIITWQDNRFSNWDIYAQKINGAGAVQWTADGVAISSAASDQTGPQITSDNAGGAIITWQDFRSLSTYDIYAQNINTSGAVQWTADGVAISTAAGYQQNPRLTSDAAGGAIITWQDQRNGSSNTDIFAQRINTSGTVQWTADGVAISTAANNQNFPQLINDGAGGAIITWQDQRNSTVNTDVYAQKINGSGAVQWTADGVAISTAANNQTNPQLASDGAGGAVLTWEDARIGGSNIDIYAQNVRSTGILPIKWLAFSGTLASQDQASLQWKVEENGVASYEVERNCGAGFSAAATITSKGDGTNSYNYIDAMPVSNGCQYRIKQIDRDGRFTYSAILLLTSKQLKTTLTLHPNPVNAATSLQYKASTKGTITFSVLDAGGRTMLRKTVAVDAGVNAIPLQLDHLSAGIYTLLLHSNEGQTALKFVKQ